jgi:RecA/RadA recombinase
MTNAVKMLNYANNQDNQTLLILISQQRNNIGAMYASHQPTGGHAVKFFSSTIVKLWSSESENQAIKGKTTVGDNIIESKIGRTVNWNIDFN